MAGFVDAARGSGNNYITSGVDDAPTSQVDGAGEMFRASAPAPDGPIVSDPQETFYLRKP